MKSESGGNRIVRRWCKQDVDLVMAKKKLRERVSLRSARESRLAK